MPDERRALTHHFSIAGQEGYLTVGVYEDGLPGEIFITMAKQGSTISGLMDSFATAVSLALQYGVPLEVLCSKFTHMRFEPSGWSGNPKIGYAKSHCRLHLALAGTEVHDGRPGRIVQSPSDDRSASECQWYGSGWSARRIDPDGRCARLQHLRFADGTERNLLPLHDVWEYKRVPPSKPITINNIYSLAQTAVELRKLRYASCVMGDEAMKNPFEYGGVVVVRPSAIVRKSCPTWSVPWKTARSSSCIPSADWERPR